MNASGSVKPSGMDWAKMNKPLEDEVRAFLYGIFGQLYNGEISARFARELNKTGITKGLYASNPCLNVSEDLSDSNLEDLSVEFARLFVGPGPHIPLYASVHRDDDKRAGELWGSTTEEVNRFMTHYGLKLSNSRKIPDHLSILFEFMEKTILAKIECVNNGNDTQLQEADRIQIRFFHDYMEPWIEKFLTKVIKMRPQPFYKSVVMQTHRFIMLEKMAFT